MLFRLALPTSSSATSSTGRHAKRATPVAAVTGLAAVFVAGLTGTASAATPPSLSQDLSRLRVCESGGDYAINTGNGFYGAYQFDAGTWRGLGYSGLAHQASPADQDAAAATLQSQRGWGPWPGCAAKLGLGSADSASYAPPARASRGGQRSVTVAAAPASETAAVPAASVPAFGSQTITTDDIGRDLPSVRAWQARMADRGWDIAVDGLFGPQSSGVAGRFATEKGLTPDQPGTVDKAVYSGAWTIPVS